MEWVSMEEHRSNFLAYRASIQPIINIIVDFHRFSIPDYIIHPDGEIEPRYNFTIEQKETLKQCDEMIAYYRTKFIPYAPEDISI